MGSINYGGVDTICKRLSGAIKEIDSQYKMLVGTLQFIIDNRAFLGNDADAAIKQINRRLNEIVPVVNNLVKIHNKIVKFRNAFASTSNSFRV